MLKTRCTERRTVSRSDVRINLKYKRIPWTSTKKRKKKGKKCRRRRWSRINREHETRSRRARNTDPDQCHVVHHERIVTLLCREISFEKKPDNISSSRTVRFRSISISGWNTRFWISNRLPLSILQARVETKSCRNNGGTLDFFFFFHLRNASLLFSFFIFSFHPTTIINPSRTNATSHLQFSSMNLRDWFQYWDYEKNLRVLIL